MSIKSDRVVFQELLAEVEGVENAVLYVDGSNITPYTAWAQLMSVTDPVNFGRAEWHLVVALRPGLEDMQRDVEFLIPGLIYAASKEMTVQRIDVVDYNLGGQSVTTGSPIYALVCEGYREVDLTPSPTH